jgi:purine-binding chemotaxis protein CheW
MTNGLRSIAGLGAAWLLWRGGNHTCALPIEHVIEVVRPLSIKVVPESPPLLRGITVLRGQATPVVDAGLLLGDEPTVANYLVAVRVGSRNVALAVESVIGVRDLPQGAELPPLLRGAAAKVISSVETLDAELFMRLQAIRLLPDTILRFVPAAEA